MVQFGHCCPPGLGGWLYVLIQNLHLQPQLNFKISPAYKTVIKVTQLSYIQRPERTALTVYSHEGD